MKNLPYASNTAKKRVKKIQKHLQKKIRRIKFSKSILFYILIPAVAIGFAYELQSSQFEIFGKIKHLVQQKIESLTKDPKDLTRKFTNTESNFLNKNPNDLALKERQEFMRKYNRSRVHSLNYYDSKLTKLDILQDKYNKIPRSFDIPKKLRLRVSFWLNIYSKYSSRYYIIHHANYPWIVYDIVDTKSVLTSHQDTAQTKRQAVRNLVLKRKKMVINELKPLLKKKSQSLTKRQKRYVRILSKIKGNKTDNIREAIKTIRIQVGQKDRVKKGFISGLKQPTKIEEVFAKYQIPTRYKYNAKDIAQTIKKQKRKRKNFSGKRFLSEFLAALYVERYQKEIFGIPTALPLKKTKTVTLTKSLKINQITKRFSVSFKDLKLFNPKLRYRNINVATKLPKGYQLRLPKNKRS